MSRIGKKVITLPSNVELSYSAETREVLVKGPLGQLNATINPTASLTIENGEIVVEVKNPEQDFDRAIWGTTRSIVANMIEGVSKGFNKELELNGVGYKMELGSELTLYIGFSHPVKVQIPTGVKLTLNKNLLTGNSIDKELLGNFFSKIYHMKPCDVYKHKGFKYPGRFYRKKVGKKGK